VNTTRRVPLRVTLRGKRISVFALTADVSAGKREDGLSPRSNGGPKGIRTPLKNTPIWGS